MIQTIATDRLKNQQVTGTRFKSPQEIVSWMGAMQAQDFSMAEWAIGVRLPGSTEQTVREAFDRGEILRTHLLRPTWHFVSSADISWMLELTAPHIKSSMRSRHAQLGLTESIVTKSKLIVEKALEKEVHLTREELIVKLRNAKLITENAQATHIMMLFELEGLVCSGATNGKKQTYALLEERIAISTSITRDEALGKLAKRYFTSHGPASIQDFIWWSGLPVRDARKALDMVKSDFDSFENGEQTLWFADSISAWSGNRESTLLLPAFDEFIISYRDRSASLQSENHKKAISENGLFRPVIVVNGKIAGIWKRIQKKNMALIETDYFQPVSKAVQEQIENEVLKYGQFINQRTGIVNINK